MLRVAELKPDQAAQSLSLSRWSRLKRAAADEQLPSAPVRPEHGEGSDGAKVLANGAVDSASARNSLGDQVAQQSPASIETGALPPLSSISLSEDFTPFMQAKVPQAVKQQALKALFKEPHFNVMDGLDIYIDDYTVFEPITPEVMATLSSWKSIMNPSQQIVTPQGYAVDVESDEGKAVLAAREVQAKADVTFRPAASEEQVPSSAARERAEGEGDESTESTSQTSDLTSTDEPLQLRDETSAAALTPTPEPKATSPSPRAAGEGVKTHIRYGKRVGDFSLLKQTTADEQQSQTPSPDLAPSDTQKNSSQ